MVRARFHGEPLHPESAWGLAASDYTVPVASSPSDQPAMAGLQPGMGTHQLAWPIESLTDDGLAEFVDRWPSWFVLASEGQLRYSSTLPERPTAGSWRGA